MFHRYNRVLNVYYDKIHGMQVKFVRYPEHGLSKLFVMANCDVNFVKMISL